MIEALVGSATALDLGIDRRVGTLARDLAAGKTTFRLRLDRDVRAPLATLRRVRLRLIAHMVDTAGNVRTKRLTVSSNDLEVTHSIAWRTARGSSASRWRRATTRCPLTCSTPPSPVRRWTCSPSWRATAPRSSSRRHRPDRRAAAERGIRSSGSTTRPRCSTGCARRRRPPRHPRRRHGHHQGRRRVQRRLPRLQHDLQPDHAGRPGRVLRERRHPPDQRRAVRGRDARAGAAEAAARPDDRQRPVRAEPDLQLRLRRRHAGPVGPALLLRGRQGPVVAGPDALRLAGRAGPDGPAGRHAARVPLGRLAGRAVHSAEARRMYRCT